MDGEKAVSNIAELREREGYTQVELAALVGVTPNTVQNWEKGKGIEQIVRCLKLCTVLKCDLRDLINDPDPDSTKRKRKGFTLSELEKLSRGVQEESSSVKDGKKTAVTSDSRTEE